MILSVKICAFAEKGGKTVKKGWKSLAAAGLLLEIMILLCGCSAPRIIFNPQELYALPTLPEKYTDLNILLSEILDSGAEYAAPASGTNTQPVQLVDLNGDGREEAVAFFRNPNEERPLKIHLFTAGEDSYEHLGVIEGTGTGIYSVAYDDLDGDGYLELMVGWKVAVDQQVLEVYSLRPSGMVGLVRTDYVKYITLDLDLDQRKELVAIRADAEGGGVADYYSWQADGTLLSQSSARISVSMAELSQQGRVTAGMLKGEIPALFVTGVTEVPRAITDILAVRNGELSNIVLSEVTGVSSQIAPFCTLYPGDLNDDGLTEVPWPTRLLSLENEGLSYQRVDWYAYDSGGCGDVVLRTYHNLEDRWYFRLPEEWVNRIWISRTTAPDEAAVTFYILAGEGEEAAPFLRITAISGSNRDYRAVRGNRFVLSRQPEVIYTAELLDANESWAYGVTADQVRGAFSLTDTDWVAGDN